MWFSENAKRFSTPLQKTKSYITMFSGRWSTLSVEPTPEPDVSSKVQYLVSFVLSFIVFSFNCLLHIGFWSSVS